MLKKLREFIFKITLKKQLIQYLRDLKLLGTSNMDLQVKFQNFSSIDFTLISKEFDKRLFNEIYLKNNSDEKLLIIIINGKKVVEKIIFSVSKWYTLTPKEYIIQQNSNLHCVQIINFDSGQIILKKSISGESLDLSFTDSYHEFNTALHELIEDTSWGLYDLNIKRLTIDSNCDYCKHFTITQELVKPDLKPESSISFKKFQKLKHLF